MEIDPFAGLGGVIQAIIGMWSLVGVALYLWYLWALSRLFPWLGLPSRWGWIPIWNQWKLIERAGLPGWVAVFFFVPVLNVITVVVSIMAIHRINSEFDRGPEFTVLGAILPPVWATALANFITDAQYRTGQHRVVGLPADWATANRVAEDRVAAERAEAERVAAGGVPAEEQVVGAPDAGAAPAAEFDTATSAPEMRLGQGPADPAPARERADSGAPATVAAPAIVAAHRWGLELPDGEFIELPGDDVVVGRQPIAQPGSTPLRVTDPTLTMSKSHVRLRLRGDRWTAEDLHSMNGLAVRGANGAATPIEPGIETDVTGDLVIGTFVVRLRRFE